MSSITAADPLSPAPTRDPPPSRKGRVMLVLVGMLLLAVLLPPYVNLKRFRVKMEAVMGNALGRRVTIGSANLRLLPRPGLDLQNVVVYDDPTFSEEPMIRSDEVTASLRLTSLWRGRLEIASLSLQYPSLNVVRARDGRWNLQALVTRAAQVPTAPTALTHAEARPRFPYIEASGARINLKSGTEKTVYALSDADLSLWLAREDEWELRLNARPIRTDFNLSDTGRIRLDGTIHRAGELRLTGLKLHVQLDRAQLGQLTTLIYNRDRGWRGSASVDATLAGTPADLQIATDLAVADFRRYDIISGSSYDLRARCGAHYSTDSGAISNIDCTLPQGDGAVTLRGAISHPLQDRSYDLQVAARNLPMQELVRFAVHAKRDLPLDLTALGTLDASFALQTVPAGKSTANVWTGGGITRDFALRSRTLGPDVSLSPIRFSLQSPPQPGGTKRRPAAPDYAQTELVLEPFPLALGGATPATVHGSIGHDGYDIAVQGEATIPALQRVADGFGILIHHPHATGAARVDLDVTGTWAGFAAPLAVGNILVRDVTTEVPGVAGTLRVASALISLAPDSVSLGRLTATFSAAPVTFDGTISFSRRCDFSAGCIATFDLHSDQVSLDDLNTLLNPELRSRPWYRLISSGTTTPVPTKLHAEGRISVGRLLLKSVAATHVSAQVELAGRQLTVSQLRGEIFGGQHQGTWQADFTGNVPSYSGKGTLDGVSLALVSTSMHDDWATGKLSGAYEAAAAGSDPAQLLQSAAGHLDLVWRDGTLRHISLRGSEPLRFRVFRARATLLDTKVVFSDSSMESPSGIYQVSGTASLGRELALRFSASNRPVIAVEGTLQKPRVTSESLAAATLKQ